MIHKQLITMMMISSTNTYRYTTIVVLIPSNTNENVYSCG